MLKVGLTGAIASGKSVVGEMFVKRGARLIQADAIATELMKPGQAVFDDVVRVFGAGILSPDGTINRPRLAALAFGEPGNPGSGRVKELNAIVHPAVVKHENEWMEEVGRSDPHAIAIVEAALILEAGMAERFDRLVVVTSTPEQRVWRFASRLGITENEARAEVARRMIAQIPEKEKVNAADFVVDNSGSLGGTDQQVAKIFSVLQKEAAKR